MDDRPDRQRDLAEALKIADLQAFLAVVDTGSQKTAAAKLEVSQSEVHRSLGRVNAYFEHPVIASEDGRPSALTSRGEEVEHRIREALNILESARDAVLGRGAIRIGFSPVARVPLARALKAVRTSSSEQRFEVRLREATSPVYRQLLLQRELDLALGFDLALQQNEGFHRSELAKERLQLLVPSERAVSSSDSMASMLEGLRRCYITPGLNKKYYDWGDEWLCSKNVRSQIDLAGECRTGGEMLALIESGGWYGFLPPMYRHMAGPEVRFVPIDGPEYVATFCAYFWLETKSKIESLLEQIEAACQASEQSTPT